MTDQKRIIETSNALDPTGFLPVDFDIPVPVTEVPGRFVVRPLSMDLLIYDYQCLMLSKEHLATSGDIWPPGEFDFPPPDFTLHQLLALLGEVEGMTRLYMIPMQRRELDCTWEFYFRRVSGWASTYLDDFFPRLDD